MLCVIVLFCFVLPPSAPPPPIFCPLHRKSTPLERRGTSRPQFFYACSDDDNEYRSVSLVLLIPGVCFVCLGAVESSPIMRVVIWGPAWSLFFCQASPLYRSFAAATTQRPSNRVPARAGRSRRRTPHLGGRCGRRGGGLRWGCGKGCARSNVQSKICAASSRG